MKKYILKIKTLFLLLLISISAKAEIPSWLVGKWTDGDAVVEITSDSKMKIFENDILVKEGSFTFDNNGSVEMMWDKDLKPENEYFLMINTYCNWLAHEGGDHFTKLPDNIEVDDNDNNEKDYSGELDSNVFITKSKRCWKNISWVYGEWRVPTNHPSEKTYSVKITPFYYQETTEKADSITDFSELPKIWYKAMNGEHSLLGDVVFIDDIYIDFGAKRIYLSKLDRKIYLEQTTEYTTTTAKTIFWIIASIIGLAILWVVFILGRIIIRFIVSSVKKIVTWIKKQWNNIHSKAVSAVESSKDQWKESATSALNRMSEEIKRDKADSSKSEQTESSKQIIGYVKKFFKPALAVVICIWLFGQYNGCGDNSTSSSDTQSADYSWVRGTWEVTTGLEKQIICLLDNGRYICQRQQHGSYSKSEETGSYYIQSDKKRIQLKDDNGISTYIDINVDGETLESYGNSYKRISW